MPAEAVGNTRNDMYLASEAIRFLMKDKENDLSKDEVATLNAYKGSLDSATKFIPTWVKIAVAIALGLGTMVGWKRIVDHRRREDRQDPPDLRARRLGRARGGGDDRRRRHVRPAGLDHPCAVVGRRRHHGGERLRTAMATMRNLLIAWVLTLPAAIMLSGSLYLVFSRCSDAEPTRPCPALLAGHPRLGATLDEVRRGWPGRSPAMTKKNRKAKGRTTGDEVVTQPAGSPPA